MGVIFLTIVHYVLCIGLILIVLLQAGKGGGLAAAFGGGSSETIFGTRRGNVLTRVTAVGVSIFMLTSLLLTIILPKQVSVIQRKGKINVDQMQKVKRPQVPGLPTGIPPATQQAPTSPPAETPVTPAPNQQTKPSPPAPNSAPPQSQAQPPQPTPAP